MQIVNSIMAFIRDMGASIMLPFLITLLGLYFGMNVLKAFRNGLMIGIGFIGINTILSVLIGAVSPITEYYSNLGTGFTITDIGWQGMSAAAWASPFALIVVPLGFILNFILIRLKFTKTLNVDLWNYWHFLLTAGLCYYVLQAAGVSVVAAAVISTILALVCLTIVLKLADMLAKSWQEYFGLPGTSCTTQAHTTTLYPICWVTNRLIDLIPGVKKINIDLDFITEKFGMWGDSSILAFLVGVLLSIITKQTLASTLTMSVTLAAAMVLMPKMVSLLMEGLAPIGKAAQAKMQKKLGEDYELYIGMDVALGLGDPVAIQTSLLMIPIIIFLPFITPGCGYFPITSLGGFVYVTAVAAWVARGDVLKTMVGATAAMFVSLVTMTYLAPLATAFVANAGTMELTEGMQVVGSVLDTLPNMILGVIADLIGVI